MTGPPVCEVPPTIFDLSKALHFALDHGRIWLNDQRMVLIHPQLIGGLRGEIVDAYGAEVARGMCMRVGYREGVRLAELVAQRWPQKDLEDALLTGPRIHTLEGLVKVSTKHIEFDVETGSYYGEFYWDDSCEAAEHLASYGISRQPVCWLLSGFPAGYTTKLFGWPVIFREVECVGMGAERCLIVGRDADAWGADAEERRYFDFAWQKPALSDAKRQETDVPPQFTSSAENPGAVIGVSANFLRTRQRLEKVAGTDATVLLVGESGVGKELFANQLHEISSRRTGPFVAVNCAAIPDNLVESELFGVEKGAYTGADSARAGYFERASKGTLFLDEISSLAYPAQGKLLRALQERTIVRLGGAKTIPIDVRVVAACNVDLAKEVAAGRFRQDLYFRLSVFPILIPPLRDRRDDIPHLMAHFLRLYAERHGRQVHSFTRQARDTLLRYDYPGNIRELQNLIERGMVYAEDGGLIDTIHMFSGTEAFPTAIFSLSAEGRLDRARVDQFSDVDDQIASEPGASFEALERQAYLLALERSNGNVSDAARHLQMSRAKLDYRLRRLGIRT